MALCGGVGIWIYVYRVVWAGLHTAFAANTDVRVELHNAVLPLVHCGHWTYLYTRWVCTVVATSHLKVPADIGVLSLFGVFYPGAANTERHTVFTLTRRGTGVTANTASSIYCKSVIHFATFKSGMLLGTCSKL